ncbi:histidine kinase [Paenibacillus sp. D2_2]|uniref:sensor histidine kinase n=1 Tax=Paenibacillus sp. D2_2 TaxID=3073092 RepID=UPI002814E908|nr:histidine kinase [Paenibacillus sp. D2_2]WMT39585.1 histidine kinase [Paenibacillus sp. D2_2]
MQLRASFPNSTQREPLFILELSISIERLGEGLSYLTRYEQGEQVVLRSIRNHDVIAASDPQQGIPDWIPPDLAGRAFVDDGGNQRFVIYKGSTELGMELIRYLDSELFFGLVRTYRSWFWFFSLVTMLFAVTFSIFMYRFMHRPLVTLIRSFRKLQEGDFKVRIYRKKKDDFTYLYEYFNTTVEQLNSLIDQVYRQKILVQRAELKQLQAQINPHFLYNSFFMLHRMIKLEDENAITFSKKLGQFFQYITRNTSDEILLIREVEHTRNYAEIQEMRLGSRLSIEMGEPPEALKLLYVPRLILQPLLENAIEHGLKQKERGGFISMTFGENEAYWIIEISDNGEGMDDQRLQQLNQRLGDVSHDDYEITGLINIHRRLNIKFGPGSGITVALGSDGGLSVQIRLAKEVATDVSNLDR